MSIQEKILRLLALGTSANENEALNASRKAQELMLEHNLSITDLEQGEIGKEFAEIMGGSSASNWRGMLAVGVARYTMTAAWWTWTGGFNSSGNALKGLQFIGGKVNLIVAVNMYRYLVETINRVAAGKGDAFRKGMAGRLQYRLVEMAKKQENEGVGENLAIVVRSAYLREREKIAAFMGRDIPTGKIALRKDDAYYRGIQAGNRVNLNSQVETRNSHLLRA